MFQVKNKAVLRLLANRQMKKNRQRNLIAIGAITLTAILFSVLFTVAGGVFGQAQQSLMRSNGTIGQAAIDFLSMPEYEQLKEAGGYKTLHYTIITGMAADQRLERLKTEVRYGEDDAAKTVLSYPTSGTMPQEKMDIAMSRLVLDAMGLSDELGSQITFPIAVNGKIYQDTFTLCGVWDGDELAPAQQVWVSKEYSNEIAPVQQTAFAESHIYEGTVCAQVDFQSRWNVSEQLTDLVQRAGLPNNTNTGVSSLYETSGVDFSTVLAGMALLLVVLISGYLIIYNVFYISVTQDIQFYGLLKTIGASGKQLRRILYRQAGKLSVIGIPIGLLAGYGIGKVLLPKVMSAFEFEGFGTFTVSPWVLLGAALFSLFTIWISCLKPGHISAKVSPVEAVHYNGSSQESGRKKNKRTRNTTPRSLGMSNVRRDGTKAVLVILSLTLSLTLLNITYTILNGFDLERYVETQTNGDFEVTHWTVSTSGYPEKNVAGVPTDFIDAVQQIPGLERFEAVYCEENYFVELSDHAKAWMAQDSSERGVGYAALEEYDGNEFSSIYAVSDTLAQDVSYLTGTFDSEKWNSDEYIIYSDDFVQQGRTNEALYQPGDKIILTAPDGVKKEFTVMALGVLDETLTSRQYAEMSIQIVMPERAFSSLYGEKQPLSIVYDVDAAHLAEAEKITADLILGSEMTYISRETLAAEFLQTQRNFTLIGTILSSILAAIGILNFVNVVVTGILTRQKELAMLNAIGMSGKQMKKMLIWESATYIGGAVILTVTVGNLLGWLVCQAEMVKNQWAFIYHFTLTPIIICLPLLVLVAVAIPLVFYKSICKRSIVERLRFE